MFSRRYTQNYSAGGSTGTVQMPMAVYEISIHWSNLANTIQPSVSMCASDSALSDYFDDLLLLSYVDSAEDK